MHCHSNIKIPVLACDLSEIQCSKKHFCLSQGTWHWSVPGTLSCQGVINVEYCVGSNCTGDWSLGYPVYMSLLITQTDVHSLKSKGVPRKAEVVLGVPGRLRPRIILTFGTTRVVGCQPYAPAAFTPGEIPGTHFQRLSLPQGTWFCRKEP